MTGRIMGVFRCASEADALALRSDFNTRVLRARNPLDASYNPEVKQDEGQWVMQVYVDYATLADANAVFDLADGRMNNNQVSRLIQSATISVHECEEGRDCRSAAASYRERTL